MDIDTSVLSDPAVRADPYPLFALLREASPFATADDTVLVVGRHSDVARVLRDPEASSERLRAKGATGQLPSSFLFRDPPDHTRLRRLVSRAFTPRVVAGLRPRITELTDALFATADPAGFDLVAGLSHPLPVRVICELLGVPEVDRPAFASWSDRLARGLDAEFVGAPDPVALADAMAARVEFAGYLRELIDARRGRDGDDLLSQLIRAEEGDDQLSTPELVVTVTLLLVAGHETTTNLIANGALALLRSPDQLAALRADPTLIGGAVEESLRYDPAVQFTSRRARGTFELGGVRVGPDSTIALLVGAANRDPAVFADPDTFDIRRGNAGQHLSFAAGAHFCLGAGLARLEAEVALGAFAERLAGAELAGLTYKDNVNLRGPAELTVTFSRP